MSCIPFIVKDSNESNDLILVHTFDEWEYIVRASRLADRKKSELKRLDSRLLLEKSGISLSRKTSNDQLSNVKLNSFSKLKKV